MTSDLTSMSRPCRVLIVVWFILYFTSLGKCEPTTPFFHSPTVLSACQFKTLCNYTSYHDNTSNLSWVLADGGIKPIINYWDNYADEQTYYAYLDVKNGGTRGSRAMLSAEIGSDVTAINVLFHYVTTGVEAQNLRVYLQSTPGYGPGYSPDDVMFRLENFTTNMDWMAANFTCCLLGRNYISFESSKPSDDAYTSVAVDGIVITVADVACPARRNGTTDSNTTEPENTTTTTTANTTTTSTLSTTATNTPSTITTTTTTTTIPITDSTIATTTSKATSTPRSTTTTGTSSPSDHIPVDKEHSLISIPFSIKFNQEFSPSLLSPVSMIYNSTVENYTAMLTPVYRDVSNFDKVVITKFWPGSIGIDYDINLKAFSQQEPVNVIKVSKQLADTKQLLLDLDNVDKTYVNSTFKQNLDDSEDLLNEFSHNVCKSEHICPDNTHVCNSTSQVCDHKCFNFRCPVNAQCYVTDQHIPMCRCKTDDKFVYGGADCSEVAEKMALTSTQIIAIGTGVGGAVVVMAVVIIAAVIIRARRGTPRHVKMVEAGGQEDGASAEVQRHHLSAAASSRDVTRPATPTPHVTKL
ncbi:mucin-5AC-like isoform X2 [Physella acuta]|uniref:mucin-5AC-like isoform X2 n=1 Tax=Physella acuta TaxID=109671 RepID=UPI0027DB9CC7|nr:mucin-5AC-like isoform X2 [Physella acuta]